MENLTKKILVIMLLLFINNVLSQEKTIKGIVLDSLNNPIKYASIGLVNRPIGTVTNNKGEFKLEINKPSITDTLKISSIGFKSKIFIIQNISNNLTINLDENVEELEEVVIVSSNKLKNLKKGKEKTKTNKELFFVVPKMKNINLGVELGRKFKIGNKPSKLSEFKFFVKKNNFKKIKFKINIYTIKKNKPYQRINKEDIIVDIPNKKTGWIASNLNQYDIKTKENIIITIQWIYASEEGDILSLPIFAPTFSSTHYYKQSSQTKWRKYRFISSSMFLKYKQ